MMIVGLETPDNAYIIELNMSSEVCLKILHLDALKAFENKCGLENYLAKVKYCVLATSIEGHDPISATSPDKFQLSSRLGVLAV